MRRVITAVLCIPLLAATAVPAQHNDRGRHEQFNRGAYDGGRGGNYGYDRDHRYGDYDRRYHQGGIGPGKGALIGGAGGAALGALFTGSAKGTIIGGAAGAGIGAVLGQHAQDQRERRY
jgi:hypothetical protein